MQRLSERIRRGVLVLRTIIGVPDYDRYLRHMASQHPGGAVKSRAEFANDRLKDRYSRPGSRCC